MGGIKREMYVNGETKIIVKIGHPDVLKLRRTHYVHLVPLSRQGIPHESRIPCLDIGEGFFPGVFIPHVGNKSIIGFLFQNPFGQMSLVQKTTFFNKTFKNI